MSEDMTEIELDLFTAAGESYTGRLTGRELCEARRGLQQIRVIEADDGRIIVYSDEGKCWTLEEPEQELRDWLEDDEYVRVIIALGLKPTLDL